MPEKFSPYIRIKQSTRKDWDKMKVDAQYQSGKSLKVDDFTQLLLAIYKGYSKEYFKQQSETE